MKKRYVIYNPIEQTYMYGLNGCHKTNFIEHLPKIFVSRESAETEIELFSEWCKTNNFDEKWGIKVLEVKEVFIKY